MTTDRIIRLRGHGPELSWPDSMSTRRLCCGLIEEDTPDAVTVPDAEYAAEFYEEQRCSAWKARLDAARVLAAHTFGRAQSWTRAAVAAFPLAALAAGVNPAPVSLPLPGLVGADWYHTDDGRAAAIVAHLYASSVPIALAALPEGFVIDALPWSWFDAHDANGYVLRPTAHSPRSWA